MYKETQADRYALLSAAATTATIAYVTALLESTQQAHHLGNPLMLSRLVRLHANWVLAFDVLDKFACTHDLNFC